MARGLLLVSTNTAPPERAWGQPGRRGEERTREGVGAAAAAAADGEEAARGSGGPSSPERRARPRVRDSASARTADGTTSSSRDTSPSSVRTASPVSLTLACHSGSPLLALCVIDTLYPFTQIFQVRE